MRVFITGATGYIGSAVVAECLAAGHEVVGLARSGTAAAALESVGATALRGALDDLDGLRAAAAAADGVVHTAFIHDFTDLPAAARTDLLAVRALGGALEGTDRPLVIASGVAGVVTTGRVSSEADAPDPGAGPRAHTEAVVLAMAGRGVRSSAVRLPPTVHGEGDHGFLPTLVGIARERGTSAFVGDGANRWPAVHRLDAAHLFRLALEGAPAGSRLHATAEEGVPFTDIADAIGRHLDVPVRSAASPLRTRPNTSAESRSSRGSTSPRRAPSRAAPSGGSRPTPACWPTWRQVTTPGPRPGDHGRTRGGRDGAGVHHRFVGRARPGRRAAAGSAGARGDAARQNRTPGGGRAAHAAAGRRRGPGGPSTVDAARDVAKQANRAGPFTGVVTTWASATGNPGGSRRPMGWPNCGRSTCSPVHADRAHGQARATGPPQLGMHLVGDLSLQGVQWAARRWNGGQAYCDSQLHDVLLGFAVALRWPDVVVNAVNPGWVPTRIGGPGGPDGMELARVTQSWLAGSDDAEARRSGRCRYHQQPADLHPSAHHRALQDHLLDRLRDLSGASSP